MMKYVPEVRSLLAELTDHEISQGIQWYRKAWDIARELFPANVHRGAGVIAALSPRQTWDVNVRDARSIAKAARDQLTIMPQVSGTYRNVEKAWRIANGAHIESNLNKSPGAYKVNNFYQNISGNLQPVTVDAWIGRAVGYPHDTIKGNAYLAIEDAIQFVAYTDTDLQPAELQAAIWIHVRGKRNDP